MPVAKCVGQLIVREDCVQADDTGLKVLDRNHVNGVKRRHMWAFVAGRLVAFHYAPDWTAERASDFLRGFHGRLQGDGYAGFEDMLEPPEGEPPEIDEGR